VAALWPQLVVGRFTDRHGVQRAMTAADVLVVTPYNNQVGLLWAALPGARIGTVDKFQGQEAPVVVYSIASSSAQDAPRGIGFLNLTNYITRLLLDTPAVLSGIVSVVRSSVTDRSPGQH